MTAVCWKSCTMPDTGASLRGKAWHRLILAYVASVVSTAVILLVLAETDLGLRYAALGML